MEEEAPQSYCITLEDVQQAAVRIEGIALRTPVLTSRTIMDHPGISYFFKVEALQKTGSFKFRGALNAIKHELELVRATMAELPEDTPTTTTRVMSVVTHSSGNHAQGLALAAQLASTSSSTSTTTSPQESCGDEGGIVVSATIVMPENAPLVKKKAVESYGATIVQVASTNEAREAAAEEIVRTTGAIFIHPSEDPRVIAGQGTTCLEMVEQVRELLALQSPSSRSIDDQQPHYGDLDVVIIPVGGGGLASGNAVALRGLLGDKVKVRPH